MSSNTETSLISNCDRYHSIFPTLVISGANEAIEYYKKVFNAKESYRFEHNNIIIHAEIKIGSSIIMITEEMDEMGLKSAKTIGNTPIVLYIYVDNVDVIFNRAIALGAKIEYPVEDQFYGDRIGGIIDPFGFRWTIASHIKDVSPDELKEQYFKMLSSNLHQTGSSDNIYRKKYLKYKAKLKLLKKY